MSLETLLAQALDARRERNKTLTSHHLIAITRLNPEAQNTLLALLMQLEKMRPESEPNRGTPLPFDGKLVSEGKFAIWPLMRLDDQAQHVLAWMLEEWGVVN